MYRVAHYVDEEMSRTSRANGFMHNLMYGGPNDEGGCGPGGEYGSGKKKSLLTKLQEFKEELATIENNNNQFEGNKIYEIENVTEQAIRLKLLIENHTNGKNMKPQGRHGSYTTILENFFQLEMKI